VTPYYVTPCGSIRIYHARWEDVLAAGVFDPRDVALVHADPPYGVKERTDRASKGRSNATASRDFAAVAGDAEPFDPSALLCLTRPTVLWGANHYSNRVPGSPSWITWDKRNGSTSDDNADCEHAWTNLGGPARLFSHLWRGMMRASEHGDRYHPTQKPEALSSYVFQRAKLKRGDLVLVPYMGSGPDLRPALAMGLRVVACEVEEFYCRTAVNARLRSVAKPEAPETLGPLFGGGR
jgi:site-specific DNA-methyltransferase (adenine-specific)/modification methylase